MDWFNIVKRHFDARRYTPANVMVFVTAGKITEEQYTEITGLEV